MSFDQYGDAGTAEAIQDALAEIAGEGQRVVDMIDKAPPWPIGSGNSALHPAGTNLSADRVPLGHQRHREINVPLFWSVHRG